MQERRLGAFLQHKDLAYSACRAMLEFIQEVVLLCPPKSGLQGEFL